MRYGRSHNKDSFKTGIPGIDRIVFFTKKSEDFRTLLSKYYEESDPIWDALRATAIKRQRNNYKIILSNGLSTMRTQMKMLTLKQALDQGKHMF